MSGTPTRYAFAWVALALAAASCSTTVGKVRARFSKAHGCPESQVLVTQKGGSVYRASGCNITREYVCGSIASPSDARECEERGLERQAPATGQPRRFPEPVNPGQRPGPDQQ